MPTIPRLFFQSKPNTQFAFCELGQKSELIPEKTRLLSADNLTIFSGLQLGTSDIVPSTELIFEGRSWKLFHQLLCHLKDQYQVKVYYYDLHSCPPCLILSSHSPENSLQYLRKVSSIFAKAISFQNEGKGSGFFQFRGLADSNFAPAVSKGPCSLQVIRGELAYLWDRNLGGGHKLSAEAQKMNWRVMDLAVYADSREQQKESSLSTSSQPSDEKELKNKVEGSAHGYYAFGMKDHLITPTLAYLKMGSSRMQRQKKYLHILKETLSGIEPDKKPHDLPPLA